MAAGFRKCQREGFLQWRQRFEPQRLRPAEGEGAGLVEHHPIGFGKAFERRAVLDQHPGAHQRSRRDDLRRRHRQPQRARAGYDQHGGCDQ